MKASEESKVKSLPSIEAKGENSKGWKLERTSSLTKSIAQIRRVTADPSSKKQKCFLEEG